MLRLVRAGEPITDQLFNELVGEIMRVKNMTAAYPLGLIKGQTGYHLYEVPAAAATGPEINFYNDSGEEIPPYGCMAVSGLHTDPEYTKVTKPSTTFRRQYLPNGATAVPAGETGTIEDRRYVKWLHNSSDTLATDKGFGPTPGEWYLTHGYPAVSEAVGEYSASDDIFVGTVHTIDKLIGKLAGTLTVGSTATVNVYKSDAFPETIITSLTVTGRDWLMRSGSIGSGTKVALDFVNGVLYVLEASCGP